MVVGSAASVLRVKGDINQNLLVQVQSLNRERTMQKSPYEIGCSDRHFQFPQMLPALLGNGMGVTAFGLARSAMSNKMGSHHCFLLKTDSRRSPHLESILIRKPRIFPNSSRSPCSNPPQTPPALRPI
ncbi:hypothetical protein PIB30_028401 [Stylosanthes scabra]|uniref:Uncharacterized protein n=1 Tax=Stylosanthes scabra TaxID=79078 RepID=A0ABU6UDL3_9FABA|nr:hypothetical protein [Stylosanthes scabra]